MTWTLTASGHTPVHGEPDAAKRDAAEQALFDDLQSVLSKPEHGAGVSQFRGNFVTGAPHLEPVSLSLDPALRHQATTAVLRHFQVGHLPPHLAEVSKRVGDLARWMARTLDDCPELTTGLNRLLDAKDSLVRAAVVQHETAEATPGSS